VTGVGGTGKTRLSAELADREGARFADGVWWCELAPVGLGADVAGAIADALGLDPAPGTATLDHVVEHLAARHGLLVLDNCEHVLDAAADVAERLLEGCPQLRLLVHEPRAARRRRRGGPAPGRPRAASWVRRAATCGPSAAVGLFLDRARAAGAAADAVAQLGAVAEICRRLDGSPLAIELAAGRTRSLAPAEIAARLDERFSLLAVSGRRAAARHRTLGAAIDWSYELLDEPQRRVFERLSVFARGATLDGARDVCAGDGVTRDQVADVLDQLVAHSLVQPLPAGGGRTLYAMLETLREYAAARLHAEGGHAAARDRHADHYRAQAQAMIDAGLAWRSALPFIDEFDDVRAALRWCRDTDATPDRAFTILVPLWGLAPARHAEDIALVAEQALERWADVGPLRLHALGTAATARLFAGDGAAAYAHAHDALALEEAAGATALLARRTLAHLAMYTQEPDAAAALTSDIAARARDAGEEALACECDGFTVQLLQAAGEHARAMALAADMRAAADRLDAPFMICWSRYVSGVILLQDAPAEASGWFEEAVALGRDVGHYHMVRFSLRALGVAGPVRGRPRGGGGAPAGRARPRRGAHRRGLAVDDPHGARAAAGRERPTRPGGRAAGRVGGLARVTDPRGPGPAGAGARRRCAGAGGAGGRRRPGRRAGPRGREGARARRAGSGDDAQRGTRGTGRRARARCVAHRLVATGRRAVAGRLGVGLGDDTDGAPEEDGEREDRRAAQEAAQGRANAGHHRQACGVLRRGWVGKSTLPASTGWMIGWGSAWAAGWPLAPVTAPTVVPSMTANVSTPARRSRWRGRAVAVKVMPPWCAHARAAHRAGSAGRLRDRATGPRMRGDLLQLDGGAGLLQLGHELLGLVALDALLHRLGGLVDERLGLLQAQARRRADDLDDLDLLVARAREDDVDRAALLLGRAGAVAARRSGRRGRRRDGRRRHAELLFERLDALAQLEHRDALELFDPLLRAGGHGLVPPGRLLVVGRGVGCSLGRALGGLVRGRGGLGRLGVLVAAGLRRRLPRPPLLLSRSGRAGSPDRR
jgi:predicted ATPase